MTNNVWVSRDKQEFRLTGWYRVLISGDSESIDGHQIYAFDAYETWMFVTVDEDGPEGTGTHDEMIETVLAWYGPLEIPKCPDNLDNAEPSA